MQLATTLDQVMKQWAMSAEPIIKPTLYAHNKIWMVELEEVWPDGEPKYTNSPLDDRVEWCCQTLKDWPNATRTSWDMWRFESKRDAEKFITLYTLVWAQ